jgi:hypothetical protein
MFRTIAVLAALASVPVIADDHWRDRDDYRRGPDRDSIYGSSRDRINERDRVMRQSQRATPVDRTVVDLRRAQSRNRYDNEKREHFERAFYHLSRFSSDWNRGSFNKDRLDDAIERIDKLAHSDQISRRDRDILRQDLADLRAFRSSAGRGYDYRR